MPESSRRSTPVFSPSILASRSFDAANHYSALSQRTNATSSYSQYQASPHAAITINASPSLPSQPFSPSLPSWSAPPLSPPVTPSHSLEKLSAILAGDDGDDASRRTSLTVWAHRLYLGSRRFWARMRVKLVLKLIIGCLALAVLWHCTEWIGYLSRNLDLKSTWLPTTRNGFDSSAIDSLGKPPPPFTPCERPFLPKPLDHQATLQPVPPNRNTTVLVPLPKITKSLEDDLFHLDHIINYNSTHHISPSITIATTFSQIQKISGLLIGWHGTSQINIIGFSGGTNNERGALHAFSAAGYDYDWVIILPHLRVEDPNELSDLLNSSVPALANSAKPVGSRGVRISPSSFEIITRSPGDIQVVPAAFLVPPFGISASILSMAENGLMDTSDRHSSIGVWAALGDSLARNGGIGGWVVSHGKESTLQADKEKNIDDLVRRQLRITVEKRDQSGSSSPLSSLRHLYRTLSEPQVPMGLVDRNVTDTGNVLVLMPKIRHLGNFHSALCSFVRSGHQLRLIVMDSEDGFGNGNYIDGPCHLHYSRQRNLDQDSLKGFVPDLIVHLRDHLESLSIVQGFRNMNSISLTEDELSLGEWIGSLGMSALSNWNTPKIELSVITHNRPESLRRLLNSLETAHYFNDRVHLSISMEQSADMITHQIIENFTWAHGPTSIRHRVVFGGLIPAIIESWYPLNNDTYGVILEDDVEVSPFFYAFLKLTILNYRYGPDRTKANGLIGISLYQQKHSDLTKGPGRRSDGSRKLVEESLQDGDTPYLSQIPCSWGAVYFPEIWREFHNYLPKRLSTTSLSPSKNAQYIVPNIRSNGWNQSWKKYMIELIYLKGYVMLYPSYDGFLSLSTNHLEFGTHFQPFGNETRRKEMVEAFDLPLMKRIGDLMGMTGRRLVKYEALPVLDLWGNVTTLEGILYVGRRRFLEVSDRFGL